MLWIAKRKCYQANDVKFCHSCYSNSLKSFLIDSASNAYNTEARGQTPAHYEMHSDG